MKHNISFKLTVVARLTGRKRNSSPEDVKRTIVEVLDLENLIPQSRNDYERDIRELAIRYGCDSEKLLGLIPELKPT